MASAADPGAFGRFPEGAQVGLRGVIVEGGAGCQNEAASPGLADGVQSLRPLFVRTCGLGAQVVDAADQAHAGAPARLG